MDPQAKPQKKNYTYMVKCRDGTFYTGWTTELARRISEHNSGKGAKYTKSRRPVELIYYEEFETKQQAMSREAGIKRMTRAQKMKLIEEYHKISKKQAIGKFLKND